MSDTVKDSPWFLLGYAILIVVVSAGIHYWFERPTQGWLREGLTGWSLHLGLLHRWRRSAPPGRTTPSGWHQRSRPAVQRRLAYMVIPSTWVL